MFVNATFCGVSCARAIAARAVEPFVMSGVEFAAPKVISRVRPGGGGGV